MCYHNLENHVLDQLREPAAQRTLNKRRAQIARVARALTEVRRPFRLPRRRDNAWFSTTQTQTIDTLRPKWTYSVQVRGREVAKLRWRGNRFLFVPDEEFHPGHAEWCWSRNRQDATEINAFLNRLYLEFAGIDMEREVQWQLASAVRAQNRLPEFNNLLPVLWMGVPTEIGTCLTARGQLGTGTLDLLARRRGGPAGARFVVFEVKGPEENTERIITGALRQAITYALALSIEANANPETIANYRTAFHAGGNAALSFRAAAVIHDPGNGDNTQVWQRSLAALQMFMPPQGAMVNLVGLLLYSWDTEQRRAYNWRWVHDPR